MNKRRPSTVHRGTPQVIWIDSRVLSILTLWVLSLKNDFIRLFGIPLTADRSNLFNKILWTTQSNHFLMSIKVPNTLLSNK